MLARWRFERRLRALAQSDQPSLQRYSDAAWPQDKDALDQAALLALDFETDGLAKNAHLLQAGWISFTATGIHTRNAQNVDIRSSRTLDDQAVTIHGIGEERARAGTAIGDILPLIISDLAGRILIAHGAEIERGGLYSAIRKSYGARLPILSICTLELERTLHPGLTQTHAYRLDATRRRYGLPDYQPHDALTDALATAELFQAQISRIHPAPSVGDLVRLP